MPYSRTKSYGGDGGVPFSDDLTEVVQLIGVMVYAGTNVDSIQSTFLMVNGTEATGPKYGGGGGNPNYFTLALGEFITTINGRSGDVTDQLTFVTNKGNTFGPFGEDGGQAYEIADVQVGGFFGRSGDQVDQLGAFTVSNG